MPLVLDPITEQEYELLTQGDPKYEHLRVRDYRYWRIYLHPNQVYLYRCYVWFIAGHIDLHQRPQLIPGHSDELWYITKYVHAALSNLSKPDMINEFWAGNEYLAHRGHAHLHLIPRYFDPPRFEGHDFPDYRFGKNFAPYEPLELPSEILAGIRDSFSTALKQVEYRVGIPNL